MASCAHAFKWSNAQLAVDYPLLNVLLKLYVSFTKSICISASLIDYGFVDYSKSHINFTLKIIFALPLLYRCTQTQVTLELRNSKSENSSE